MSVRACFRSSGWVPSTALAFGFVLSAFVACNADDPPTEMPEGDPADCRLIANRCHSYAPESELAHDCHETGHDGADPARCTELKASCLDECPPREPDSGAGGSFGGTSTGGSTTGGSAGTSPGGAAGEGGITTGGSAGETSGGGSSAGGPQGGSSSGGSAGSAQGGASGSTATGGSGGSSVGGAGGMGGRAGSGGTTGETACDLLGRLCHDGAPGRAQECHEIGHDGDESVCEEELAECLALCQDGGA
jgi:hypothetical protein